MNEQDLYAPRAGLAPPRRAPTPSVNRTSSLPGLIARIEEAVESETASIRTDMKFDLKASNARKSRHLWELNKALRDARPEELGPDYRDAVLRLRAKLAANEAAIRAHLDAVNEVAALLQDAIERSEADGTYSTGAFGRTQ